MTTTIITNLLGPICELFYKSQRTLDLYQANINTVRNYGFSTESCINFGFELYQPFDINAIKLQPGVYTTESRFVAYPDAGITDTISVTNAIALQELGVSGISTATYEGKTLPLIISLIQSGNTITGIASNYATNGVPYSYNDDIDQAVIRQFESDFANNDALSALVFVNLVKATFVGIDTQWQALPTSLYELKTRSYRYNNGFGQFYSYESNSAFVKSNLYVDELAHNQLYASAYALVYNWINYLDWNPDFTTWVGINSNSLPVFLKQFTYQYFDLD